MPTLRRALMRLASMVGGSAIALAAACSGEGDSVPPACLDVPADASCTNVLYGIHGGVIAPTFQDVFDNTLQKKCGVSGCHAGTDPAGGLHLDEITKAHSDLLAPSRVKPGDVKCGAVIVRLETDGEPWSMPKGSHLDDGSLCAIRHWIKDGAKP